MKGLKDLIFGGAGMLLLFVLALIAEALPAIMIIAAIAVALRWLHIF